MTDSLFPGVGSSCVQTDLYRYALTRTWDPALPACVWVMLNPSTADALVEDPTTRRLNRFTSDHGFGGYTIVNLFAYRSPAPRELVKAQDPIGPDNLTHVHAALATAGTFGTIIAGWGTWLDTRHTKTLDRLGLAPIMRVLLEHRLHCLETTKNGNPRHPLYVHHTRRIERWTPDSTTTYITRPKEP